jgi:hypothetical protein
MSTGEEGGATCRTIQPLGGRLRAAVAALSADQMTAMLPSGWPPKAVVAHLAFWTECMEPGIAGVLRNSVPTEGWRFGSGFVDDGEHWPSEDEHNAREAAWASEHDIDEVVDRLLRALDTVTAAIESFTDGEARDQRFVDYVTNNADHLDEHAEELEAAAVAELE